MDRDYAQQALENRATVDDPTGADRNAGIVLGAAVIARVAKTRRFRSALLAELSL